MKGNQQKKKDYIEVSRYRYNISIQLSLMLDYLLSNDDYEQDLKLKAEIKLLRHKHKLTGNLAYARITGQIEIEEITFESKINEDRNDDTTGHTGTYQFHIKPRLAV